MENFKLGDNSIPPWTAGGYAMFLGAGKINSQVSTSGVQSSWKYGL